MTNGMVFGLGREATQRVSTEEEFWAAIHSACDFIIYLKKSGLNIVLPEDETSSRRRFETLVHFIMTEQGVTNDRPAWLTDELVRRGAETVGARIDSMQQHLFEPPVLDRMRAIVNRCL
ncbi:hypothetical protein [Agrobacterium tumefaciens]|uniref:hypothetical protein n=1 Tax=Agrobacterium tumefaciens TaxID=358 RepID=UPI0015730FAF|nr:hypothetical protein [Agrobacterium tumefaciens]